MQKTQLKLNKSDISYEIFESNTSNSDTILILHWWQWASSSWTQVWDLLNMEEYNVIIPDIPWASKNTTCNDIYTLDLYAELIEDFVNKLKEDYENINFNNLIILWHSNGWAISIKIASRGILKFIRLVLNNSAWIRNDKKRTFKRKFLSKLVKYFWLFKKVKFLNRIRKLFYKVIWWQDYLKAEENPNLKQTYLNMISSDLKNEIKDLDCFTLLIWGEKDTYTPVSDWYFMRENIKKSKLIVLENETHGIHLKNPKRLVETFLQNI